jgi:histidine triad (HIT) family protein
VATLPDLPVGEVGPLFALAQRLTRAVPQATGGDGAFVAINNVVSQSVPHLHVHVVPRRHDDRLFSRNLAWTRHPYRDDDQMRQVGAAIRAALGNDRFSV